MIKFSLSGVDKMAKVLNGISKRYPDLVSRALYIRASEVMKRSKNEFVPVDLGVLRASGTVHPPERKGREVSIAMSYGGAADPYAIAVHEHLSEFSPPSWVAKEARGEAVEFHPEGRGPKYLERPLMEAVPGMAEQIAEDVALAKAAKE